MDVALGYLEGLELRLGGGNLGPKLQLVIELVKHRHFLTNYLKLQILASYNNLE